MQHTSLSSAIAPPRGIGNSSELGAALVNNQLKRSIDFNISTLQFRLQPSPESL